MIAADTNVVVRLITADDKGQTARAETLLVEKGIYLGLGVVMETEWVLRAAYRWPRDRVSAALSALLRLDGVTVDRVSGVDWALARHAAGADLADMLHLVAATGADGFATFDRGVSAGAGAAPPLPIDILTG